MAGKPELSASTGVQNVVVYVSDGNFAQAYTVGQQNVAPFNSQASHNGTMAYTNTPHSLASMVGQATKAFPCSKPSDYPFNGAAGYFTNNPQAVISQNGFPQSCNTTNIINGLTAGYQNIIHNDAILNQNTFKNIVNYGGINTELFSGGQRQAGPGRPEIKLLREDCDNNREGYSSADSGYVSVVGGDASSQSVRCDSVRSETAESSCSSLSSTDEGSVLVQQQGSEMVVYDGSVSVRPGGVVLAVGPPGSPQAQTPAVSLMRTASGPQIPSVSVPFGWKRLINNGNIVYISPNNSALGNLDQVKEYLLTPGTCKCGLECPLKYDTVFNFDPKVIGKPWSFSPDTNTRDLTKLCNHKRKIVEMSSIACKPPDQIASKDFNTKRKKRKSGSSYSGASVSQILAQRERLSLTHPVLCKEGLPNPQFPNQVWPNTLQHPINRCYTEAAPNPTASVSNSVQYFRYQNQDSSVNRVIMDQQHTVDSANISQHNISNYHYTPQNLQVPVHPQHIIGPNGQIIGLQGPVNSNMISQQQKLFINSPPIESNAPGRPNIQMVPIVSGNQSKPERTFCNQPFQYHQGIIPQQYDASRNIRPPFIPRDQQFSAIVQQQQNIQSTPATPLVIHQQRPWQPNRFQQNNSDERVPPLFQHTPAITSWSEDNTRKKSKTSKTVKKRPFNIYDNQAVNTPCPNIDVRQIPTMNQSPQIIQGSSSPSFMDDPSGYLAQQTALLNSTFSKQTGSYVCNLPGESNEVPLPSNMPPVQTKQNFNRNNQNVKDVSQHYNQNSMAKGPADSTGISMEHMHCQGCIDILQYQDGRFNSRPNSQPNSIDDPVTSSTYSDRQASPDSRPIQGGTISTSNGSPNPTSTTPQPPRAPPEPSTSSQSYYLRNYSMPGLVTTMASGRTVGSNTITSVQAGKANTSTVSINNPLTVPFSTVSSILPTQAITVNVSRSPLEMVQSVVSSIQVPQQQNSLQIIKHSPPGHILVSSGGQLIMPPPPPKIITNQNTMPPISVSPMVTNVTAAVTQVIPAVAQQVLGQQTVLVNALPAPFVIQPGVAVTMDGINQNIQLPHIVTGNVIQQVDPTDGRILGRTTAMISPDLKKKGKKRKMASQTIASMLQIAAAQQNPGIVMSQPGFPQQVQMAHSPQGIATTPVMQALTIVPGKPGAPPHIVMNSQGVGNPNQINLLQPVNLINSSAGMVQNFPTIQQFIVPNLGSMVMNADGTATILQDAPNLGMQLQLQNVNGQNVLTPIQNNVFNSGQSILTAAPTGMVIRSPGTSQGKIIQQQHSPGAQFLSPNGNQFVVNGAQFSGQLSPLVANVSPTQMTFSTAPQPLRSNGAHQPTHQDFIQCGQMGQTLMVPAGNITVSSANQQNTTYVQQNTTIVQQQTTMVANNTQTNQNCSAVNVEQNFNRPLQTVLVQQTSPACRHSVSTQTAINQNTQAITTNTFCQTSSAGSPPDTTTHSPLALEGADTTTHSGSTDDGLSPAPSNCSDIVSRQQSCSMAMVHCISSSEPDSADLNLQCSESDWTVHQTDIKKCMGYSTEPTTVLPGIQFITEQMKQQEAVVSSRNHDKINRSKHGDTLVVMENRHTHLSIFEDNDENVTKQDPVETSFVRGDLVWGPVKGYPAWPGKLIEVQNDAVLVKWFGGEKTPTKVNPCLLQTLTEGLEAHHHARKNCRKSRKLDNQLENAIQEAMAELDNMTEIKNLKAESAAKPNITKKPSGRLRSSQNKGF